MKKWTIKFTNNKTGQEYQSYYTDTAPETIDGRNEISNYAINNIVKKLNVNVNDINVNYIKSEDIEKLNNVISDKETVYVGDKQNGIVKIVTENGKSKVYALKEIIITNRVYSNSSNSEWQKRGFKSSYDTYRFVWNKTPNKTYSYKPYENKDVDYSPKVFIEFVRTWTPYKIRKEIK